MMLVMLKMLCGKWTGNDCVGLRFASSSPVALHEVKVVVVLAGVVDDLEEVEMYNEVEVVVMVAMVVVLVAVVDAVPLEGGLVHERDHLTEGEESPDHEPDHELDPDRQGKTETVALLQMIVKLLKKDDRNRRNVPNRLTNDHHHLIDDQDQSRMMRSRRRGLDPAQEVDHDHLHETMIKTESQSRKSTTKLFCFHH